MLKNIDDRAGDLLKTQPREGRPPSRPHCGTPCRGRTASPHHSIGSPEAAGAPLRVAAGATLRSIGVKEEFMETILFFVVWLGGALLHTLFDLKIKPVLRAVREESDLP